MRLLEVVPLALVLALGACRDDIIDLEIKIPAAVPYDAIRVSKSVDGKPAGIIKTPTTKPPVGESSSTTHYAGIYIPRDARNVEVLVQAVDDSLVTAQDAAILVTPVANQAHVDLRMCTSPYDVNTKGNCLGPGALPPYTPPLLACMPPTMPPPPLMPHGTDSAACITYCDAMDGKCSDIYATKERCLHACALLAWPESQTPQADTLHCRQQFVESIMPTWPPYMVHTACVNASIDASPQCGDACGIYCRTGVRACPGTFPPFDVCAEACRRRDQQVLRDTQKSLYNFGLQCRLEQLARAVFDPSYCEVASPAAPDGCAGCAALGLTYQ
jgi:hypothetical protein